MSAPAIERHRSVDLDDIGRGSSFISAASGVERGPTSATVPLTRSGWSTMTRDGVGVVLTRKG
ncbi:MAG: hypothetical protein EA388_00680 [Nitriliruptor sp.]|nr:MAG: hypothetical protein EA388_00680 [Nitriliruptor sp.]